MISKAKTMVSVSNIKRVVSVFIIRPIDENPSKTDVAVFRRCPTMPTFANHWAGISGSIEEEDNSPFDAAVRELQEETNIADVLKKYFANEHNNDSELLRSCMNAGLHLDVPTKNAQGAFGGRIIRVYPFALKLPEQTTDVVEKQASMRSDIEMRGTEHDEMKFISVEEFLDLSPCVPGLQTAFHHATAGSYLNLPSDVRVWESDRVNGAAFLAREAVSLAAAHFGVADSRVAGDVNEQPNIAQSISMLRPSMVPIVNAVKEFDRRLQENPQSNNVSIVKADILRSLELEAERCVDLAVETILSDYKAWRYTVSSSDFVIGTFSRSSTLKLILGRVLWSLPPLINAQSTIRVVCSQSTPGNEGELMAGDIHDATCLSDSTFQNHVKEGKVNLVIVGADCILSNGMGVVNKVGTSSLAQVCKSAHVPIKCFADRWKEWDDVYPPPLEEIFEIVPEKLLDCVVVPVDS